VVVLLVELQPLIACGPMTLGLPFFRLSYRQRNSGEARLEQLFKGFIILESFHWGAYLLMIIFVLLWTIIVN